MNKYPEKPFNDPFQYYHERQSYKLRKSHPSLNANAINQIIQQEWLSLPPHEVKYYKRIMEIAQEKYHEHIHNIQQEQFISSENVSVKSHVRETDPYNDTQGYDSPEVSEYKNYEVSARKTRGQSAPKPSNGKLYRRPGRPTRPMVLNQSEGHRTHSQNEGKESSPRVEVDLEIYDSTEMAGKELPNITNVFVRGHDNQVYRIDRQGKVSNQNRKYIPVTELPDDIFELARARSSKFYQLKRNKSGKKGTQRKRMQSTERSVDHSSEDAEIEVQTLPVVAEEQTQRSEASGNKVKSRPSETSERQPKKSARRDRGSREEVPEPTGSAIVVEEAGPSGASEHEKKSPQHGTQTSTQPIVYSQPSMTDSRGPRRSRHGKADVKPSKKVLREQLLDTDSDQEKIVIHSTPHTGPVFKVRYCTGDPEYRRSYKYAKDAIDVVFPNAHVEVTPIGGSTGCFDIVIVHDGISKQLWDKSDGDGFVTTKNVQQLVDKIDDFIQKGQMAS